MVSWQVDRGCHLISAKAFDNLCKAMKMQKVDRSEDVHPQDARPKTEPVVTSDVPMGRR